MKAAEKGDAEAQYLIGQRIEPQSPQQALVWYKKAAAHDFSEAKQAIERLNAIVEPPHVITDTAAINQSVNPTAH